MRAHETDPLPLEEQDRQGREGDGDWVRHEGQNKIHFFAILADNADYYEIRYDSREMTWQLTRCGWRDDRRCASSPTWTWTHSLRPWRSG
jgi:hypothetical protein